MFIAFTAFMLTLVLLDLGFLLAVPGLVVVGGYAGIILAICAWYASAAGVINHAFGRMVLPLGSPFQLPAPGPAPATPEPTPQPAPTPTPTPTPTPEATAPPTTGALTIEPTTSETIGTTAPETATGPVTVSTQPLEKVPKEAGEVLDRESTEEAEESRREDLRRTIRESVRRSEMRVRRAPQAGTPAAPGIRADAEEVVEEVVEEVFVQDTEGSTREEIRSIIRESVGRSRESVRRSGVGDREAPQAGTPAAPEIQADAEELPIKDYDSLNLGQVAKRLAGLSIEELERLWDYEAKNKNRRSLVQRFERRIRAARKDGTTGEAKGSPEKR